MLDNFYEHPFPYVLGISGFILSLFIAWALFGGRHTHKHKSKHL